MISIRSLRDCAQMNTGQRRAFRLYLIGLGAYFAMLPVAFLLMRDFKHWPGRPVFMVLPLVGIVVVLRAMMLYFSTADEMQRRILSEGCAYAFVVTIFAELVCGFFEGSIPAIPWAARFVFMMVVWGFSVTIVKKRYQ